MIGINSQQLLAVFCLTVWYVYAQVFSTLDAKMLTNPKRVKSTALANRNFNAYFKNNQISNPKVTSTPSENSSTNTSNVSAEQKEMAKKTFEYLRDYRKTLGLSDVTWSEAVYSLCVDHNKYQIEQGKISHDNFATRVKGFQSANENVAMFTSTKAVTDDEGGSKFFTMWKNSPGHDANMKSTSINQGAVAIMYDANSKGFYATMINVKTSTP